MDLLDGMRVFVRVVDEASFTRAAQALRLSRSSASEKVRELEESLGVRLLQRTTRRVGVTEAGRAFYARSRRAIEEADAARREAQALSRDPRGRLRVGAPEMFARLFLVPALTAFLRRYPSVSVELIEAVRAANLVEEELDVSIRIAGALEPGLVARRIGSSRVVICAAPGYLSDRGAPLSPDDVQAHDCLGFAPLAWGRLWTFARDGQTRRVDITPRVMCTGSESLLTCARAGLGLAPLPHWAVGDDIASGALVSVLPDWSTQEVGVHAIYPSNRQVPTKVRAFVAHIARELKARGL
ncbi:MAG: LysR family transcriptional regulator [Alphaproteobacteria bacterium]|nr:LysR family transcriptional regulator [Alphaproteobacteria bacterium]